MLDIVIPAIVYIAILYFLGAKAFWFMVIVGAIIGVFVILWLFLEKDPEFKKYEVDAKNLWKKIKKESILLLKDIFSIK